jgi:hypothetical protein
MIVTVLRRRLRPFLTLVGLALVAAGTTVGFSAAPAQAALSYQGTFTIRTPFTNECAGTQNNGTARQTLITVQACDGSSGQRWAIFLDTGANKYWILAHGGAQPLNMCMDTNYPINQNNMWIWNCNGGRNQQFSLTPGWPTPQKIFASYAGDTNGQGTRSCVNGQAARILAVQSCGLFPHTNGADWRLVPA